MKFLKENVIRNRKVEAKLDEALGLTEGLTGEEKSRFFNTYKPEDSETYKSLCTKYDENTKLDMAYNLQEIAKYFDDADAEAFREKYGITMPVDNITSFADSWYEDLVGYDNFDDEDEDIYEPSDEDLLKVVYNFLIGEAQYIDNPAAFED